MANDTTLSAPVGTGDTIVTVDMTGSMTYPASPVSAKLAASVIYSTPAIGTNASVVTVINPLPVEISDGTNVLGTVAHPVVVSGAVSISGTVAVSGTFWQTTQPVSIASLPALAAGSANIGGVELIDSGGTNKASISAGGALKVDGSAVTQPVSIGSTVTVSGSGTFTVSGTVTANAGTGTFTVGGTAASGSSASGNPVMIGGVFNTTQPTVTNGQVVDFQATARGALIVATGIDTFTVAVSGTTTVAGTVTANIGTTNGLALDASVNGLLLAQGSTTSGETGPLIQGAVTTAAPSYTTAKTSPLSLTPAGALRIDGSAVTQPASIAGTVTVAGSGTFTVSGTISTNSDGSATGGTAGSKSLLAGGIYDTSLPTLTNGQQCGLQLDASGRLIVNVGAGSAGNAAASATGSAVPASADYLGLNAGGNLHGWNAVTLSGPTYVGMVDLSSVGGTAIALGQTAMSGSIPVALASNQSAIPVSQSGTWNIGTVTTVTAVTSLTNALPAGSNAIGGVTQSGSWTIGQAGTWTVQPGNTPNTTPWLANEQDPAATTGTISAHDTGTTSTANSNGQTVVTGSPSANSSVSCTVSAHSDITIQITGTAVTTGTFSMERSMDGGTTFVAFSTELVSVGSSASSWTITDNNALILRGNVGEMTTIRVRATGTFTATSFAVKMQPGFGVSAIIANQGPPNSLANGWSVQVTDGTHTQPTGDASTRSIHTTVDNASLTVTGSGTFSENVAQIAGTTTSVNEGSSDAGTQRMALGSDDNLTTDSRWSSADTNLHSVKASAGRVFKIEVMNTGSAPVYMRLYNKASAPVPASDAALIVKRYIIPGNTAGAGAVFEYLKGRYFSTGIAYDLTNAAGDTDATVITLNQCAINVDYK
jgi:hypothetical protein